MKLNPEKNLQRFSSKLYKQGFKLKIKPIRGLKLRDDPRDAMLSFNSGNLGTTQALQGSVNPDERNQIITEMSREASRKVPSVSHSRPATGRNVNGLNSNSTNRKEFVFGPRASDHPEPEYEDGIFCERSYQQDLKISGGGSNNENFLNSITYDVFNNSYGGMTPRDNLFEPQSREKRRGANTIDRAKLTSSKFFQGVKSDKNEKKKFEFPVDMIVEKSESKYSQTVYKNLPVLPENSEQIVEEFSNKLSQKSESHKSESLKKGRRKKNVLAKLNKKVINDTRERPPKMADNGPKSTNQLFNVPSILKSRASVKKGKSVRFKEGTNFFPPKLKEVTEKSFAPSGNTSNMIPSISRKKLKPCGDVQGNHIRTVNEVKGKGGVQSLQPKPQFRFFANQNENKNSTNQRKNRGSAGKSLKIEEKTPRTEKTLKKEGKSVLNLVSKRVLKRVKECIRGIENLKVKIDSDEQSKKITFNISDTKDDNFGLQFDFVMNNPDDQDIDFAKLLATSNEATPFTPGKRVAREEKQTPYRKRPRNPKKPNRPEPRVKSGGPGQSEGLPPFIDKDQNKFIRGATEEVGQFEQYMKEKLNSPDWGAFAKHILQLLYGLGISLQEFKQMKISCRKMFNKLVVDRYFKNVKQSIWERLSKNEKVRALLAGDKKSDLDIWGVSIEDYKMFFGDFQNYFEVRGSQNYPELDYFFKTLRKNVDSHCQGQVQILSAMSHVNSQKQRRVPSKGAERRRPSGSRRDLLLGKRSEPMFRCDDFSVVQGSPAPKPARKKPKFFPVNETPREDIFIENEEHENFDLFKMTPSCRGNTSANPKESMQFTFQNTQMMLETPKVEEEPVLSKQLKYSVGDLRRKLGEDAKGQIDELIGAVTPNVLVKDNLMKNFKFFLSNLTNDLILHMVKIKYLKKGKKIDDDGDGRVDEEVSELVGQIVGNLLKDALADSNSGEQPSGDFLQTFDYEVDFKIIQEFLASREALNCLQRKKNNKPPRSKRNDEKVKKVYKKIMNQFLDEFKKKYFGVKDREDPNTYTIPIHDATHLGQTDYSYAFKPKEMELCFYAHYFGHLCLPPLRFRPERVSVDHWTSQIEGQLKKWGLTGLPDKEISTRAKMLIEIEEATPPTDPRRPGLGLSKPKSFKEYRERNSLKLQSMKSSKTSKPGKKRRQANDLLKITSFFDPTKKNFEKKMFKSFTQDYFNHLLRAEVFREKVVVYLKEKFVVDFMKDYPNEIAKKLERNRFHMLDLQKKKSKFLWNRYELLVALEYFKEKYCKRIFSSDFSRTMKRDSLGLEMESFPETPGALGHQSGLLKYFVPHEEVDKFEEPTSQGIPKKYLFE